MSNYPDSPERNILYSFQSYMEEHVADTPFLVYLPFYAKLIMFISAILKFV